MDRIMRVKEVMAVTGLSRTTIWRLERSGEFPASVQLSAMAKGWRASAIAGWVESRE